MQLAHATVIQPAPAQEFLRPPSAGLAPTPDTVPPALAALLPGPSDPGLTLRQLGAPPAAGSPAAAADLRASLAAVAARTHAGDSWARAMDLHGTTHLWRELATQVAGDPALTQALLGAAFRAASMQSAMGKRTHGRLRPFQLDPGSIPVIGRVPKDASYPSGHAARAFAAARVLSTLDPAITEAAYGLAREVAASRVYAGVHFVTDVVAGARLGHRMAESVLERWRGGRLDGISAEFGAPPAAAGLTQ